MRKLLRYAVRALTLRCPVCGRRGIVRGLLRLHERCPHCGQPVDRAEEGYFLGALLLNLVVAELVPAAAIILTLLVTWPKPPWRLVMWGGVALAAACPFLFFPITKLLWLGVDLYLQPELDERRSTQP